MKAHLRVTWDDEDDQIAGFEATAAEAVEGYTQRLLTARAAVLRLPGLPDGRCPLELPGGRVAELTSVTVDGAALDSALAVVGDSPALLLPASDWPRPAGNGFPVVVSYVAGYDTVPADLVGAVRLIAASLYRDRENAVPGALVPVPVTASILMARHRIRPR
jgi:uncharacterized phiE125 gp8 family phage protein